MGGTSIEWLGGIHFSGSAGGVLGTGSASGTSDPGTVVAVVDVVLVSAAGALAALVIVEVLDAVDVVDRAALGAGFGADVETLELVLDAAEGSGAPVVAVTAVDMGAEEVESAIRAGDEGAAPSSEAPFAPHAPIGRITRAMTVLMARIIWSSRRTRRFAQRRMTLLPPGRVSFGELGPLPPSLSNGGVSGAPRGY
ncbi:MAG: hypothetical protein ACRDV9_07385 [Acidimicrobiia bacterium]